MSKRWQNSTRSSRLPSNWRKLRQQVLARDGFRCCWHDVIEGHRVRCLIEAVEVDHIKPGDDHSLGNLQSLCSFHHGVKTHREGVQASAAQRAEIRQRLRPEPEKHPGLVEGERLSE